jgi:hypothetical protein
MNNLPNIGYRFFYNYTSFNYSGFCIVTNINKDGLIWFKALDGKRKGSIFNISHKAWNSRGY